MGPSPEHHALGWLFVDMNSFFASAEKHLNPHLRDALVGVIPVESDHTCVIAACPGAKRLGVKTGTPVQEARRRCPGITLVRARPAVYVDLHHAVMRSIDRCAPIEKTYSIDEWALRLMGSERSRENAVELARAIKHRIAADLSPVLSCSIGIAPTRLLAKIASDLRKPDGLTVLTPGDLPHRLADVPLGDLIGIGRSMEARLEQAGITTVPQLWNISRREAAAVWGSSVGGDWWAGFHGIDEPERPTRRGSMSHSSVLDPRFRSEEGARRVMARLVTRLGVRLRADGYVAGRLGIDLSHTDRHRFSAALDLPHVQDTAALLGAFTRLWDRRPTRPAPLLKVGAVVSELILADQTPRPLFGHADRGAKLSAALDTITRRWGTASIYYGSMHGCTGLMEEKIAFGRIPWTPKSPQPSHAPR